MFSWAKENNPIPSGLLYSLIEKGSCSGCNNLGDLGWPQSTWGLSCIRMKPGNDFLAYVNNKVMLPAQWHWKDGWFQPWYFIEENDFMLCYSCMTIGIHPSPKVMANFFKTRKFTWCPYPICTIFGGYIKCMQVFIFCAKYIDFLH